MYAILERLTNTFSYKYFCGTSSQKSASFQLYSQLLLKLSIFFPPHGHMCTHKARCLGVDDFIILIIFSGTITLQ